MACSTNTILRITATLAVSTFFLLASKTDKPSPSFSCQLQTASASTTYSYTLNLKDHFILNCTTTKPGNLSLYKDGALLERSSGKWLTLAISNATEEDAARYQCGGFSRQDILSCDVVLHITAPPKILHKEGLFSTSPQVVIEGTDPELHCYASGWPRPLITWLRRNGSDTTTIENRDSYLLKNRDAGVDLKILGVTQKEHGGLYVCAAANHLGSTNYSVSLLVKDGKPLMRSRIVPVHTSIKSPSGSNITLGCVAYNVPKLTTLTYWAYNNSMIYRRNKGILITNKWYTDGGIPVVILSLTLFGLSPNSTGTYSCVAVTVMRRVKADILVNVVSVIELSTNSTMTSVAVDRSGAPVLSSTLALLLVGLVMVILVVGLAARWRMWQEKRKREMYTNLLRDDLCKSYKYDLFITFSSHDFSWVKENLIPLLESHGLNYCIHHRDFELGKAVLENMAESIYQSKKVVAVISRNYMSSRFCREELDMALYRAMELDDASLLMIRVDSIDRKNLPKSIRRRTFLDYSDKKEKPHWQQRLIKHVVPVEGVGEVRDNVVGKQCEREVLVAINV